MDFSTVQPVATDLDRCSRSRQQAHTRISTFFREPTMVIPPTSRSSRHRTGNFTGPHSLAALLGFQITVWGWGPCSVVTLTGAILLQPLSPVRSPAPTRLAAWRKARMETFTELPPKAAPTGSERFSA